MLREGRHVASAVIVAVFAVLFLVMIVAMWLVVSVITVPCSGNFLCDAYRRAKEFVEAVFALVAVMLALAFVLCLKLENLEPASPVIHSFQDA